MTDCRSRGSHVDADALLRPDMSPDFDDDDSHVSHLFGSKIGPDPIMVVTEPVRIRFCTPGLETRSCEFVWRDLMAVVDLLAYEPSPSSAFSPSPQAFSFPGLGLGRCGRTDGRPAGGRGREAISRAWSVPAHPHFFRIPIRSGPFRAWLISFF